MRCPHCDHLDDKVLESRQNSSGTSIRRRRECTECGYRFTSYERIEDRQLMVVKRDGRREPFELSKLERGLRIATEKRNLSQETIEQILHGIEDEMTIKAGSRREVLSQDIGDEALKILYKLDTVAYIRFASVYRAFSNVEQFIQEIETLTERLED